MKSSHPWNITIIFFTITMAIVTLTGCRVIEPVVPQEGREPSNPQELLGYVIQNQQQNTERIKDWEENHKVFNLELENIEVEKGRIKFHGNGKRMMPDEYNVKVECEFENYKDVLIYSNGDTVQVNGETSEIKWTGISKKNLYLKLEGCRAEIKN